MCISRSLPSKLSKHINFVSVGQCDNLPTLDDGTFDIVEGVAPNVGTVAKVLCDPGYEQDGGQPVLVCLPNATWSSTPADVSCLGN